MAWKTMDVQEQRVRFVVAAYRREKALAELCREFGISRPVGYEWLKRYRQGGVAAIAEGSRLEAPGAPRLKAIADRGLMLSDGAKYLSLAVPLGEYAPSGAAAARLRAMFAAAGTRSRDGIRIPFNADGRCARTRASDRGADRDRERHTNVPRYSTAPLTRAHFELSGANELFVRRSVS